MRKLILLCAYATFWGGSFLVNPAFSRGDEVEPGQIPAVDVGPEATNGESTGDTGIGETAGGADAKRPLTNDPAGMKRLNPKYNAWIDPKFKRVVVDGEVCLTEGQLEMFACLKGTKEHESIVAVDCKAYILHAALLAVGAEQGTPVRFSPTYQAASGTPIDIQVVWTDAKGVHRVDAKNWVKNSQTGKTLADTWVFAGSGFYEDEDTKVKHYMAEGGDLICVSNFPSAMLDLPIESSQSNSALAFVANTKEIPPRGTKVRLVLTPRQQAAAK